MSGRTATITAPCVTMRKRSTRNILDGTATIRQTSIPFRPLKRLKSTVAYMGGADAVIRRAREDFKNGEYRFVAEVANKLVFADASNQEARDLAADAYEQLGYLAESATWRNAYLYGAFELRRGTAKSLSGNIARPGIAF